MNQKFLKDKSNILIVVLIVTAVVLGYFIYSQNRIPLPNFSLKDQNVTPTLSKSTNQSTFTQRRPTPAGLTADEKALLSPPASNATPQEKGKHFELVKKMAKDADVLELNSCEKPSPLVLLLKKSQEFKVSNTSDQDRTIVIDRDHKYKVPANGSATFKADFGRGNGAYGYLCDELGGVVGFFFVTE